MATKTLLDFEELKTLKAQFKAPPIIPSGEETEDLSPWVIKTSQWIEESLVKKFSVDGEWKKLRPIILGSWARHRLCPKSDIDLIFLGPEESILPFVNHFSHLKIRYRVPQDLKDWKVGVEAFDLGSLFEARAFFDSEESLLREQKVLLMANNQWKKQWLQQVKAERVQRHRRWGEQQLLEPNIKYGRGGLRDIQQGLVGLELFKANIENAEHAYRVLCYYRDFFTLLRQKLHLMGSGEVLSSHDQQEMYAWCGFDNLQDFMREVVKGYERVGFYTDWIFASALRKRKKVSVKNLDHAFQLLLKSPNIFTENAVRQGHVDQQFLFMPSIDRPPTHFSLGVGQQLKQFFHLRSKQKSINSLFKSRVLDYLFPEMKPLIGLVQHDQYHRYTADQHLKNAIINVKKIAQTPKLAGPFKKVAQMLKPQEWQQILWAAFFHDLLKGTGGDHDTKGALWAKKRLRQLGVVERDVVWLVQEHLALSTAAFRKNPRSAEVWADLFERGLNQKRLRQLMIFTVADIIATNPEAWTPWKGMLLYELYAHLSGAAASELDEAIQLEPKARAYFEQMDPFLLESLGHKVLLKDWKHLKKSFSRKSSLPPLVIRRNNNVWVRFHSFQDKPGTLLSYVVRFFHLGVQVEHASIHTLSDYGIYDWFKIQTSRSISTQDQARRLKNQLLRLKEMPHNPDLNVYFDEVELTSETSDEAIITFRGSKNQRGVLLRACQCLLEEGLSIRWARVHTWGRSLEDQFCVDKTQNLQEQVKRVAEKLRKD